MLEAVSDAVNSSRDLLVFWQELLSLYRDLLVCKISSNPTEYLDLTDSEYKALSEVASKMSAETLSYHCSLIEDAMITMQKSNAVKRIVAEMTLVRMCDTRISGSIEALTARVYELEQKVKSGVTVVATSEAPVSESKSEAEKKPETPKRRAPIMDDDDDMFKSDAPPSAKKSVAPASNKRVLRPYKNKAEVLDRFSALDPMNASFISQSKWYTDEEGRVVLKFETPYIIDSIKMFNADTQFIEVISSVSGIRYTKDSVLFEVDGKSGKNDLIDEIIQNSEQ